MENENKDVKQEQESNAQEPQAEETASTTKEETVEKGVYEKVKEAMRRERKKRQELQKKLQAKEETKEDFFPTMQTSETTDNDVNVRLMQAEAKAQVAIKLAQEPDFKDRMELVQETMEREGKTLDEADAVVKAHLYDEVIKREPNKLPTQLKPSATQEQPKFKSTGDPIKDMQENPDVPVELKRAIKNKFRT
jgi:hypothetical protein